MEGGVVLVLGIFAVWLFNLRATAGRDRRRLRRIAEPRVGESRADFLAEFAHDDDEREVAAEAFRRVQAALVPDFPLRADDDLTETLGIGAAALADILEDLVAATGRTFAEPTVGTFRNMRTLAELVRFVAAQPRRYGLAAREPDTSAASAVRPRAPMATPVVSETAA